MTTLHDDHEPISSYALIGDCHSTALVGADGSIDWACLRRFDSGGAFCRLLDAKQGGAFELRPAELIRSRRSYLEDTNVLETEFETRTGRARVLDCFAMRRGGSRRPLQQLLRVVEGLEGQVTFEVARTSRSSGPRSSSPTPGHRGDGPGPGIAALVRGAR